VPLLLTAFCTVSFTMGTSRRQRSKAEGTFLENVREQLQLLLLDVADIKASLHAMKQNRAQFPCASGQPWLQPAYCNLWDNSWHAWTALDFTGDCGSLDVDATKFDTMSCNEHEEKVNVITRDSFLSLRRALHIEEVPSELKAHMISAAVIESIAVREEPPKINLVDVEQVATWSPSDEDLSTEPCTAVEVASDDNSMGRNGDEAALSKFLCAEARSMHESIMDKKRLRATFGIEAGEDVFRRILAQSAALLGQSMKFEKEQSAGSTGVALFKSRFEELKADLKTLRACEQEATEAETRADAFKIKSMSARLGMHQRVRDDPPTTKTKRPGAKHRKG